MKIDESRPGQTLLTGLVLGVLAADTCQAGCFHVQQSSIIVIIGAPSGGNKKNEE